jgi:hypothetical protein
MGSILLRPRLLAPLLVIAIFVPVLAKDFVLPRPQNASTYPAHDAHRNERVSIAVDPYDTIDKAKIFDSDYLEKGLLPIYFVVTNSGDRPVTLVEMRVNLVTRNRTKIQPASEEDVLRRFSKLQRRGGASPLPIPLPRSPKAGVSKKLKEELETAPFRTMSVEPNSTVAGFFFFDVRDLSDATDGASIYVTGVRDGEGNDLMYFEIPLDKAIAPR